MHKENRIRISWIFILLIATISLTNCTKLVEVDAPVTTINGVNVYAADPTAIAVVTGMYTKISNADILSGGVLSLSLFPGLSSDEFTLWGSVTATSYVGYYKNALTNSNTGPTDYWRALYPFIYMANSAIEGLTSSATLTPAIRQQLIGEAKFTRAFCYFYLVNLYGEVPLTTGTDYSVNASLSRTPVDKVWEQIVIDLKDAQDLLSQDYLDGTLLKTTSERIRPTKWAATALLARVYLYIGDWKNAATQASQLIDYTAKFGLSTDLNATFLANSNEAVWQLQPVNVGQNTQDGKMFVLPESGPANPDHPVYLSRQLLDAFETGDLRKVNWVDSIKTLNGVYHYPYKYKVGLTGQSVTEYAMVLRLGEQFLIRAEARAQQGDAAGAISDINLIRRRAGLPGYSGSSDKTSLLKAVMHERQVELFSEWGHRWLDLKRIGTVDEVMSKVAAAKGGSWNQNWQWYPISLTELRLQPRLVQNVGY